MVGVAVDTAGAHQTHQVDGLAGINGSLHVLDQHGVLEHLAVLDGLGDEGELLVDDAASAHVGVANLRVAHLAVGRPTAMPEASMVVMGILHQSIQMGLLCSDHGVAVGLVRHPAEAIHDAQKYRFLCIKLNLL